MYDAGVMLTYVELSNVYRSSLQPTSDSFRPSFVAHEKIVRIWLSSGVELMRCQPPTGSSLLLCHLTRLESQ